MTSGTSAGSGQNGEDRPRVVLDENIPFNIGGPEPRRRRPMRRENEAVMRNRSGLSPPRSGLPASARRPGAGPGLRALFLGELLRRRQGRVRWRSRPPRGDRLGDAPRPAASTATIPTGSRVASSSGTMNSSPRPSSASSPTSRGPPPTAGSSTTRGPARGHDDVPWTGSLRGKLGYAVGNVLPYHGRVGLRNLENTHVFVPTGVSEKFSSGRSAGRSARASTAGSRTTCPPRSSAAIPKTTGSPMLPCGRSPGCPA